MLSLIYLRTGAFRLESPGPRGTLWASLGLIAFYLALIWLNTLLGFFLTPLITGVPVTWLLDWLKRRKNRRTDSAGGNETYQG